MTTIGETRTGAPDSDAGLEEIPPRRSRRGLAWSVLVAVLLAAGTGAWLWAASAGPQPAPAETGPAATAVIERGTITAAEDWDGTLGYGTPVTISSPGEGTITRLPDQGETVKRGDVLLRVDEQPVTLLHGRVPMYRDLAVESSGVDVKQFEANLAALGYEGFTADDAYTAASAVAVRAWQEDIGLEVTGTVSRSSVIFLPRGNRIDGVRVNVGAATGPGTPILDITGTRQVVSLEAPIDDRDRFDVGTDAAVVLPGGDEITGTVSTMAVVAAASGAAAGPEGAGPDADPIIQVEIALDEQVGDELVGAPVDVVMVIEEREDVLLVPVNALLALAEGGYGLEVVGDRGATSIVAVTPGLFGDGKVEIQGDGTAEGTVVGVAGR